MSKFQMVTHSVDFCVVGGGLAGLCASVAAARRGLRVALMQDRPMLGGNASSETRMWVLGAQGRNKRETGIVEELMLENYYRNPYKNYSIWDSIMYEAARMEKNITLLLNCSCMDAEMSGNALMSVTGWQTTTQKFHKVESPLFADCSGDSVLAPLTGAEYRVGHEARGEFDEDIAPVTADKKTMGMSILIQARETDSPKAYIPPVWAEKYTKEHLPYRTPDLRNDGENFWYLELGGVKDCIADTEELRDELLAMAYGMWDFVKNNPENKEKYANFDLDWIGFLPGKRESRRYVGDYIMIQNDVRYGKFDDIIAYGGWPMDDHDPEGFRSKGAPNVNHYAPSPFGVPYRCLYSKNVDNLLFAGRNISISHVALSATRVMATCAILGQAAGTAAVVAAQHGVSPRGVYEGHITELQDMLMEDDCWLPGLRRKPSDLTRNASLDWESGDFDSESRKDPEILRNGVDRPTEEGGNCLELALWGGGLTGGAVTYSFDKPIYVDRARLVFDSDLNRDTQPEGSIHKRPMYATYYLNTQATHVPQTLTRGFRLVITPAKDGMAEPPVVTEVADNHQRLVYVPIGTEVLSVRFEPISTWGSPLARVFGFDLY